MAKTDCKDTWYLYIAECRDKTYYTGIARDPDKRIQEHNNTNRCRYTRYRKPLSLKYREKCHDYNSARKRESEIKQFSRKKKWSLISVYRRPE